MQAKNISLNIRKAGGKDYIIASRIMQAAAHRLIKEDCKLWSPKELAPARVKKYQDNNVLYLVAHKESGKDIGTVCFLWEDPDYWPDLAHKEAAYIHRLVIDHDYSGHGLGRKVLKWAEQKSKSAGRKYMRLDCQKSHPGLIKYYKQAGYTPHSQKSVNGRVVQRFQKKL